MGQIITEWVGQAQSAPKLQGNIEGAPPARSENLTQQAVEQIGDADDYNEATTIEFGASETVTRTYSTKRDTGIDLNIEGSAFLGPDLEADAGTALGAFFGFEVTKLKGIANILSKYEAAWGFAEEAEATAVRTSRKALSQELRGRFISDAEAERETTELTKRPRPRPT